MAFFGLFGNDEEEQQAAPKRSAFGGIGNFLMGALKFALIAVAAVLTLGAVFHFSKDAKDFADNNMRGLGTGTLDLIKNGWNKITDTLGFSNTPKPPEGAKTSIIDGVSFPVPAEAHLKNPISADPNAFRAMLDVPASRLYQKSAAVPKADGERGLELIDKQIQETINIGLGYDKLNKDFLAFKPQDPNAPKPQMIDLKVPALATALDEYGARKFQTWRDASPLEQINLLMPAVAAQNKEPEKFPPLEKIELSNFNVQRNKITDKIDSTQSITEIGQVVTPLKNNYPNRMVSFDLDKEFYNQTKLAIKILGDKGRFPEAETIATQAKGHLEAMRVNLRDQDKDRGQYYNQIIAEMDQIKNYTTQQKDDYIAPESRRDFAVILNKTVANLYNVAREAPVQLADYTNQLTAYKAYKDSMANPNMDVGYVPSNRPIKKSDASPADKSVLAAALEKGASSDAEPNLMAKLPPANKRPEEKTISV